MTAPVGPLADEAARLLQVVAQRLTAVRNRQRGGDGADQGGGGGGPGRTGDQRPPEGAGDDGWPLPGAEGGGRAAGAGSGRCPQCGHDPAGAARCTGCPLCAVLALIRGERPEVSTALVDGALAVVQALRGLLTPGPTAADGEPGGTGTPSRFTGDGAPTADEAAAQGPTGLVRIDIG